MKIYRVVARDGLFVGKWHTSKMECEKQIERILNSAVSTLMFGEDFTIEWAWLEVD